MRLTSLLTREGDAREGLINGSDDLNLTADSKRLRKKKLKSKDYVQNQNAYARLPSSSDNLYKAFEYEIMVCWSESDDPEASFVL